MLMIKMGAFVKKTNSFVIQTPSTYLSGSATNKMIPFFEGIKSGIKTGVIGKKQAIQSVDC